MRCRSVAQPRPVRATDDMPTPALIVLALVTVATVAASGIAVDARYRHAVPEAGGGEAVFPELRGRAGGVAAIEVGRAGSGSRSSAAATAGPTRGSAAIRPGRS